MSKRSLLAAAGVVFLVAGPAGAANRQDWAQCRGSDPALAIAGCGRVVSDQAETAENRAEAFLRRAGAYRDRGDSDAAIADYGEAVTLAPRNAAAYVSRALVYFRNGDRDRAIVDFAVAARLDAKGADDTAAVNPDFARIAAMARGSPPAGAPDNGASIPAPFCPTSETARNGFALVSRKEQRRLEVKASNSDVATQDYFVDGERAIVATYYKGLLIVYGSMLESYINSYDIDYTRQGTYQVGEDTHYHGSSVTLDGRLTKVAVERRVVGQEKLAVGDCSFDTFIIESETVFPDGQKTHSRSNFSPALRMNLRFTTTTDGAKSYDVNYDLIEPLSR
jgi:tetratricopeptide (TPR) repeat protein